MLLGAQDVERLERATHTPYLTDRTTLNSEYSNLTSLDAAVSLAFSPPGGSITMPDAKPRDFSSPEKHQIGGSHVNKTQYT